MIKRIAINPGFIDFIIPNEFIAPVSNSERHFRLTVAECIDNLRKISGKARLFIAEMKAKNHC